MELGFTKDRLLGYRIRPVVIRAHSRDWPWLYRPEFVDPAGEGRVILDRIWNAHGSVAGEVLKWQLASQQTLSG